ncbi:hypothetical protein [Oceanithermus sp.]|uniref:hypothetical protein n=1 Tax=Oceanithermus sp. TaxID=2268145 RepID=UPI00257A4892|nr:hypothetical protein [Oceanithermus sp.]
MMGARRFWIALFLAVLSALAVGQVGNHPLVVPGTELGWESARLELVLRVTERTPLKLSVYSPGFDPNDYRAPNELGDERYDGGKGELKTLLEIFDAAGAVRLRREWGIEPHRWYKLADGVLAPGDYLITVKFFGNGKNALAFKLDGDPAKVTLQVAPGSMQTYNVHGPKWVYPFALEKRDWTAPLVVGIYDGDGPGELQVRARKPDGTEEALPAPPNGGWVRYPIEEVGSYRFGFRQPEGAKQFTNTVGFEIFLGDVVVEVVDEEGRPVEGAAYATTGYYDRTVRLTKVPEGWTHVATVPTYGKKLAEDRVLFGPGGGRVRFVLRPKTGTVVLQGTAVCAAERFPAPLVVKLGDRRIELDERGEARVELPAGRYPVAVEVSGARAQAPAEVTVAAGGSTRVELRVEPRLDLAVAVEPADATVGDRVRVVARLQTTYPYALPAGLRLSASDGLRLEGNPAIEGTVRAGRPLELVASARAEAPGVYEVKAASCPCAAARTARLEVRRPAVFTIEKEALTPEVPLGGEARFAVRVANRGERAGRVRLRDMLPAGLSGEGLDERLTLDPGAERRFEVAARVTEAAAAERVNTAVLFDEAGRELARASASVRVLVPDVGLSRTLDKRVVVPGETVTVCLQVANTGPTRLAYTLTDRVPDWLEPEGNPRFEGALDPGARSEHCYPARVRFGPEAEGRFHARLSSDAGERRADDTIRRLPLGLEKRVDPERLILGQTAEFTVTVTNPTDHALTVRLQEAPDAELGMEAASETLTLKPGERREQRYPARPTAAGRFANRASAYVDGAPAAFPAKAELDVRPEPTLRRVSEVRLPFRVEGRGDGLLVAHRPPEGARYRLGSSRLDGLPAAEPRRAEDGRLIWKLPFAHEGVLSYTLEHEDPLPELPEPALTLLAGDRELPLAGRVSLDDYERAQPLEVKTREGMIREPAPGSVLRDSDALKIFVEAPYGEDVQVFVNDEPVGADRLGEATYDADRGVQELRYYGVPLAVGVNRVEVRAGDRRDAVEVFRAGRPVELLARPLDAVADGRTPVRVRIEARDAAGLTAGSGFVTVASEPEPLTPDANPAESGYQVLLRDGAAEIELAPMVRPGEVRLRLAKDAIESESRFYVAGSERPFWLAQGSVTARYGGSFELGGLGRAYGELPLAGGTLQAAVGTTAAVDAGGAHYRPDLADREDPNDRFPLTGAGTEGERPLASEDGVALRYDRQDFTAGYHRTALALPGVRGLPNATALYAKTRGPLEAGGFLALLPAGEVSEVIVPDGTRTYLLSQPAEPGSETVELITGARTTRLVPLRDYVLDAPGGVLTLARPLWPSERNLEPVRLRVTYAPASSARDVLAFGAGGRYRSGPFSFGAGVASLDRGATWKFGAEAAYRDAKLSAAIGYGYDAGRSVFTLRVSGRQDRVEAAGDLRYDGALQGRLRLAGHLSKRDAVVFEHRGRPGDQRSDVLFERRFDRITGGLGLGYAWDRGALEGVGRVGYRTERAEATLTHRQSFSAAPSLSVLAAGYSFDANLKAEAELAQTWGVGTSGTVGLKQRLGPANLALSYRLPGASGGGNRARFGVDVPLPFSDRTTLDLSAGYEKNLGSGDQQLAAGVGVRYRGDRLTVTAGVEGASGTRGGKLTLRSGAAGQLDARQTVSFDANYVLASETRGRFTLAYAFRGEALQFLTYHRLVHAAAATTLEGEFAPVWHPSLAFQLRPSAAYRVAVGDPGGSLYQLGLGANYYFSPRFGLGAGLLALWQPGAGVSRTAFNLEGSFRVADPVWVNLGYTFGGFQGLTPEARPGIYLRLDFFGGSEDPQLQGGNQ